MGMSLLGPVLQPYMDPFLRGMSAFNWFIKKNVALFPTPADWTQLLLSEGQLYPAVPTNNGSIAGDLAFTLSTPLGSNGMASDKTYLVAVQDSTRRVFAASGEAERSDGTATITNAAITADTYHCYVITCRRDSVGIITKVSTSQALNIVIAS
jgi:hypothetical protein